MNNAWTVLASRERTCLSVSIDEVGNEAEWPRVPVVDRFALFISQMPKEQRQPL